MVIRALIFAAALTAGCSLVNAGSTHTENFGRDAPLDATELDAGELDADLDAGEPDAGDRDAPPSPPTLRVVHLARDNGPVDVFVNDVPFTRGLAFSAATMPTEVPEGELDFLVARADAASANLTGRSFPVLGGHDYTLVFFGDEIEPPVFAGERERTLGLLLLDDVASALDPASEIGLTVIHVASPVIAGQLVAVRPPPPGPGNLLLVSDFGFQAVAPLPPLPSMTYRVGFDAGAEGVVDVSFDVPKLVPGTYANVFVAARPDDSVFLLVNTRQGGTLIIDAN